MDLTFALKLYAKTRKQSIYNSEPGKQQEKELFKLILKASETRFGKDYNFSSIDSVEAYQKTVPLRKYEDFWQEYWKDWLSSS